MKTKEENVTDEIAIWAIPTNEAHPFRYELRTASAWQDGAVKVHAENVTLTVPAGINLVAKAVETLEDMKTAETKEYNTRMQELDSQITSLQRISYVN